MFRRLFWFLTGAATGVWATVRVGRAVRRLDPDSLAATAADRALATGARLRLFAQDVRHGMAQRETELHDALGLRTQHDPQALPAGRDTPALPTQGDDDHPAARRGTAYRAPVRRAHRKDGH
ncbi:DUF6167 family protein [Actinacidiphila guanduensis]|uniref:Secreted protein n=1 Tax=Actinacidiphila guanduensis TaxID=310781 RepID=A0A1H0QHD1_9ACTN|nr:DUF6167 family protein [Actinacidiphila guanduensis]SDP16078.1 hypothetical protein SAMN05216259_118104 [Actinacidiphila guanduensis]